MAGPGTSLLIGKGVSAFGSLIEGEAEARASEFNAGVERWNAGIVRQNAAEAERRFRRMSRKRMGSARASAGASGFTLSGSALDALADSAMQEELEALTIRYEGEMQAKSHEFNAQMDDYRAKTARTSGLFNAIGELF